MKHITIQDTTHTSSGQLWMAWDYLILLGCFGCAFGVLSPLNDVELVSMIAVPFITVAVLALRGGYRSRQDSSLANTLGRLVTACILAVVIWVPVFSVYADEHSPWSSVPLYLTLALIALVTVRRVSANS